LGEEKVVAAINLRLHNKKLVQSMLPFTPRPEELQIEQPHWEKSYGFEHVEEN
jgi:hypothetical protein